MVWSVVFANREAQDELDALGVELRARFERIIGLIQSRGLEHVREPYVKHLEGKLWEIRMVGREASARSIYMTISGKRMVILHSFVKKMQKTPARALATARARAKLVGRDGE